MAKVKANIDENTLAELKKTLLEKRKKVEANLLEFAQKNKNIKDDYSTKFTQIGDSPDDNAAEVEVYTDNLGVEHQLEGDLLAINEALERMEKGTYGICKNCGELQTIEIERLKAFPEAKTCLKCEKEEKK